jgi:histidinol-phosphate/aromatic aminotransferase/cobyric acid decarboxylase-like protein
MEAIVLAAGFGRRMRPISERTHKALIPIGGTTILARIVESLQDLSVSRVTVVTGYRAEEVRDHLEGRFGAERFQFVDNDRFAETNNIVSLALGLAHVDPDEDVILVECDLLFDRSLLAGLAGERRRNVALLDRYRTGMDGTVVSVDGGVLTEVFPPEAQGADFSYHDKFKTLNVYRFDALWCQQTLRPLLEVHAREIDDTCYYEVVLGTLVRLPEHRIEAQVIDGGLWSEVDDPVDLEAARFHFEPESRAALLDRGRGGRWGLQVTDFSLMHNVHFPTPAMLAALRHALPDLLSSYGSAQQVLNEKLSWFVGCDPARLQVLHGASQAFPLLAGLLGGTVAVPSPTFGEFERAFPDARTYRDAPGVATDELDDLAGRVDLLVVVNPNNPTGTTLSSPGLHELIARHPATTFLVDESFIEFSGEPPLASLLEEAPLDNAVVLVSLSKTLGVPGIRLGYLYSCREDLLAAVGAALPIWNVSSLAEFFVELLLKFRPELAASIERTAVDRKELRGLLLDVVGVAEVHPSGGNFLLVDLAGPAWLAGAVRERLLTDERIEVKDVTARFDAPVPRLRVAVRGPEDNRRFASALAGSLAAVPW